MTSPVLQAKQLSPALARIIDQLQAYEPEQIILFGSQARGDADGFSDIDLIVIKDTTKSRPERTRECRQYLLSTKDIEVDVVVYTPAELEREIEARSPFIAASFADSILVYDRHPAIGKSGLRSRIKVWPPFPH